MKRNLYFTRLFFVSLLIFALLTLSLFPAGYSYAEDTHPTSGNNPLCFLHSADLHVTDASSMEEFKQIIAYSNSFIKPAFTLIGGDTPDGGTLEQYKTFKQVMDTLAGPVYNTAGDHEIKSGNLDGYKQVIGQPTYSFEIGKYHFIGMNSASMTKDQLEWAVKDLSVSKEKGFTNIMFIHHNIDALKEYAASLNQLVKDYSVKLVLAGHTHYNQIINDGAGLQITTTSLKSPKGTDPKGYGIVTIDNGLVAWHFAPIGQDPVVAITSPISKIMNTGKDGVVAGKTNIRAKAFSSSNITKATATIDESNTLEMTEDNGVWSVEWDSATVKDGEHTLAVEATEANGKKGVEKITFTVNQSSTYQPSPVNIKNVAEGGDKGKEKPDEKEKAPKKVNNTVTPENGKYICTNKPAIRAVLSPAGKDPLLSNTVKVLVNGADLSSKAVVKESTGGKKELQVTYTPGTAFTGTEVTVDIQASDSKGIISKASTKFKIDITAPTIKVLSPLNTITTALPTLSLEAKDSGGSGINAGSFVLKLDGLIVPVTLGPTGIIKFKPFVALSLAKHTITAEVRDSAGNIKKVTSYFTIAAPKK